APVTITEVGLADAEGLELVGARALPSTDESQLVADGWPPHADGTTEEWAAGADAVGVVLQPDEVLTLWAGVRAPSGSGTAEAVRVHYRRGDETFWQDTVDTLRISSDDSC